MQHLSPEQDAQRRALYDQGLNDAAIGRALGCDRTSVRAWRVRKFLPAQGTIPRPGELTVEKGEDRLALYRQGLNDREIAARQGVDSTAIFGWRKRHGLPPNLPLGRTTRAKAAHRLITPTLKLQCIGMLERNIGPTTIARELSVAYGTVCAWRTEFLRRHPEMRQASPGLRPVPRHASGRAFSRFHAERRRRAFELYAQGLSDRDIATELAVHRQQVSEWRAALYLPPNSPQRPSRPKRKASGPAITPLSNPLYAQIAEAVGRAIAPDLRDDVISDMWLAIAEGRLSEEQVAVAAAQYRGKTIGLYASRFGPRSLDEDIGGEGDGFRMLDLIRDDRSASWLEKMGATVW